VLLRGLITTRLIPRKSEEGDRGTTLGCRRRACRSAHRDIASLRAAFGSTTTREFHHGPQRVIRAVHRCRVGVPGRPVVVVGDGDGGQAHAGRVADLNPGRVTR